MRASDASIGGIILNLLEGESILYNSRAGWPLGGVILPPTHVVATNKRFIVVNPATLGPTHTYISYDKIISMDVKRGLAWTELTIILSQDRQSPINKMVRFDKISKALTMFSIISNQIAAMKDIDHQAKREHHRKIDAQNAVYLSQTKETVAKFARKEEIEVETPRVQRPLDATGRTKPSHVQSLPKIHIPLDTIYETIKTAGSLGMKMGSYLVREKALRQTPARPVQKATIQSVQTQQRHASPGKFDPDKEMRIFKMRHVRKIIKKHEHSEHRPPSLLEILNI